MDMHSPVFAYLEKPSMVDFPKHLSAVFFAKGCNFSCGFCHNTSLMGKPKAGLPWEQLESICAGFRKQWVSGAVVTGGEPTLSPGLPKLLRFLKERFGIAVKLDTNGSNPDVLAECLPLVDYVAMDIKCDPAAYPEMVGYAHPQRVRQSIQLIRSEARDYEFRTTIIESIHGDEQMDAIAHALLGSRRYVLQPFVPRDDLPDRNLRSTNRTPPSRLHALKQRLEGCAGEILVRGS